jgi:hypothetical protein
VNGRRPCRWRGWVIRIPLVIGLLALGALTSIAVAWGIEIRRAWAHTPGKVINVPATSFAVPEAGGRRLVALRSRSFGQETWIIDRNAFGKDQPGGLPSRETPAWVGRPGPADGQGVSASGYGFPWICLKSESTRETMRTGPSSFTTHMSPRGEWRFGLGSGHNPAQLPMLPIWPGLAADACVFALLIASPLLLARLRRHLRALRGRCPACGYDLRGAVDGVCPEWGRGAAPAPAPT